jgi:hypothetical protein
MLLSRSVASTTCFDHVVVHLQSLKALEELDLRNTQVTETGADKLRERLPTAKIFTKLKLNER